MKIFILILFLLWGVSTPLWARDSAKTKQLFIQSLKDKDGTLLYSLFSRELRADINAAQVIMLLKRKEAMYGAIKEFSFKRKKKNEFFFVLRFETGEIPLNFTVKNGQIDDFDLGYFLPVDKYTTEIPGEHNLPLHVKLGTSVAAGVPKGIMIMLHDRGPGDYNGISLTDSARQEQSGLFYRFSRELRKAGFVTVRYNKRSAELMHRESLGEDISLYLNKRTQFSDLIADAKSIIHFSRQRYPSLPVYLLGFGEGAQVALHVASKEFSVKGVILIGASMLSAINDAYREFVYQPHDFFRTFDKNKDGVLTYSELDSNLVKMDLNRDNQVTIDEYNTVNLTTFYSTILEEDVLRYFSIEQLTLPQATSLLKKSWFKVIFLHGTYDRVVPVSFTRSIELQKSEWRKGNFNFIYVPHAGHELNPKRSLLDDSFVPANIERFTSWANQIRSLL